MEFHLVVDEIEEHVVRLEDAQNATTVHLPRSMMPPGVIEGDVITMVIAKGDASQRRESARDLMNEVLKNPD